MVPAGATLLSFVVALVHFTTELLIFKTMSIKGAATPMVIAGDCNDLPPANSSLSQVSGCIRSPLVMLTDKARPARVTASNVHVQHP